jgi:hypothetical protein
VQRSGRARKEGEEELGGSTQASPSNFQPTNNGVMENGKQQERWRQRV